MKKTSVLIIISILFIISLFAQRLEIEGDLKVMGNIESTTIDSMLQIIDNLQAHIDSLGTDNEGMVLCPREFSFDFSVFAGEVDTLSIFDLTGLNLDRVSIEIVDVAWTSQNDQDIEIKVGSYSDSTITINHGSIEARGDFDGTTEIMRYRTGSVSFSMKSVGRLMISAENPYLIILPYEYNGFGGSGTITVWITSRY